MLGQSSTGVFSLGETDEPATPPAPWVDCGCDDCDEAEEETEDEKGA
jgi:hypothetical protein